MITHLKTLDLIHTSSKAKKYTEACLELNVWIRITRKLGLLIKIGITKHYRLPKSDYTKNKTGIFP